MKKAIVRRPSNNYQGCISSHPLKSELNLDLARKQHKNYVGTLRDLGLDIIEIDELEEYPDSCFVEDNVIIHKKKALLTRMGASSRRGEVNSIIPVLSQFFNIIEIEEPATIEGGDVIHIDDNLLISGNTKRTNELGINQASNLLGVSISSINDPEIIHLKSYMTYLGDNTFVSVEKYIPKLLEIDNNYNIIIIPSEEAYSANTLTINGTVIIPKGYPQSKKLINDSGFETIELDISEFRKCEGALTCLSIIF